LTKASALAGAALAAALSVACDGSSNSATAPTVPPAPSSTAAVKTLQVAQSLATCTGVSAQTCLQVRETEGAAWTLLYDAIAGFDYEPGFLYQIQITEEKVANPPADASSVRRTLVSVLSKTPAPRSPAGATWRLTSIAGRPVLASVKVTAEFGDGDRVSGSGGCNRYTGGASIQGERLKVGAVASTRMFCFGDDVMEQEQQYFDALSKATSFRLAGAELFLGPSPEVVTLVFTRE
jgi:heat shock protein HslJ